MGVIVRYSELLNKINMKQLLLDGNISLASLLWYIFGMIKLLVKKYIYIYTHTDTHIHTHTHIYIYIYIIDTLILLITLGQCELHFIILEYSLSPHTVFRNEIRIRPIIIRRPKAPGIWSSLGKILGKSQLI